MATCYRHPTRETGVACSNCGRPICPDCMTPTPVGMRCPECSREKTKVHRGPVRRPTTEPTATYVLIAISVLAYVGELASGGRINDAGGTLYENGVLWGPYIAQRDEIWRMVTSGFLHASLFHILFNMWFIWVLGRMLEPVLGHVRFVTLYFTALLCGSFAVLLLEPTAPTIGASGAAFGLLGAAIVEARARGLDLWASGLALTAGLNFLITFTLPGISIGGHVGGFLGGLLVAVIYQQGDRMRLPRAATLGACIAIAVLAVLGGVAVAGSRGLM
ncbi:rhomboid family intramembrane serine protease [Conexibacter woesei]|uniref:Rhomboid family protein n=1 Tax=Conexibacter woesei (strain DSM 14684 / CCUG 47730 / CIP 108061 / JCM 11494 / NBRC 100937 / ID131577) TaxID=469383 RepID=D3F216_CONWI|nr:rhomboid family intramembrane serine protease [Conexibacter woesei]ADB50191.1 Rhomboid family protein [Conexibacter woesei DSM 14684]